MLLFLTGNSDQREISDFQNGTVCGQTGCNSCGNGGTQIPADGGSADQYDLRLILVDYGRQCMSVRLGSVYLQFRIVHNDNLIRTVLSQLVSQTFYLISDEHCHNLRVQICSKFLTLPQQFKCNAADLIVNLLGKYIYAFIFFKNYIVHD